MVTTAHKKDQKSIPRKDASEWVKEGQNCEEHEDALQCFCSALEIEPQNKNALFNKGVACLNLGRCNEALKCFEFLAEQDPDNATLLEMKGRTYQEMHAYRKAVRMFSAALDILDSGQEVDDEIKQRLKRLIARSV